MAFPYESLRCKSSVAVYLACSRSSKLARIQARYTSTGRPQRHKMAPQQNVVFDHKKSIEPHDVRWIG